MHATPEVFFNSYNTESLVCAIQFRHLKRIKPAVDTKGAPMLHVLLCPANERERLEPLMKSNLAPFTSEITIAQAKFH